MAPKVKRLAEATPIPVTVVTVASVNTPVTISTMSEYVGRFGCNPLKKPEDIPADVRIVDFSTVSPGSEPKVFTDPKDIHVVNFLGQWIFMDEDAANATIDEMNHDRNPSESGVSDIDSDDDSDSEGKSRQQQKRFKAMSLDRACEIWSVRELYEDAELGNPKSACWIRQDDFVKLTPAMMFARCMRLPPPPEAVNEFMKLLNVFALEHYAPALEKELAETKRMLPDMHTDFLRRLAQETKAFNMADPLGVLFVEAVFGYNSENIGNRRIALIPRRDVNTFKVELKKCIPKMKKEHLNRRDELHYVLVNPVVALLNNTWQVEFRQREAARREQYRNSAENTTREAILQKLRAATHRRPVGGGNG